MRPALQNPFYYLDNFQQVLAWIGERHGDLLDDRERAFLDEFASLPQSSRALLVRMVMRKGSLFRAGKLRYAEIGCPLQAATALLAQGWIDSNPQLSLTQLFALLNKSELVELFGLSAAGRSKADLLEALQAEHVAIQPWSAWCLALDETAFELRIDDLCERLRLMFFGNIYQDWSEFVLADLGIFRYEQVAFSPQSRAFSSRQEVDSYLQLQRCREQFEAGASIKELLALIPQAPYANPWLENRRGKLLLRIGQQCERNGELALALRLHAANRYPGARARAIRVLERCAQPEAALELALAAQASPEGEHEAQQLQRILPRLRRALGQSSSRRNTATAGVQRIDLALPRPPPGIRVEQAVRAHLAASDAPVHYVENALLNSLLGLLCWDTIFAPLPGAFFHPFHAGPADLARADFYSRRAELFQDCLSELEAGTHKTRIRRVFREKYGIQSQFVSWGLLDEALLEQALDCLPAAHLDACFRRILADVPNHRSGLPDLIQFWPAERRYRMIEVKGPGDRLQDNQLRWLDYACQHNLPVAVCHVQWIDATP